MKKINKFIEYSLYGQYSNYIIQDNIFRAIKYGVQGLVLPSNLLANYATLIPPGISISVLVDYPNGTESTAIRQHCITSAINKGATAIDLVAPHYFLINKKPQKFIDDIKSCYDTCYAKKNVSLRVILDYRLIEETDEIDTICVLLQDIGIEYVLPSTGFFVDDFWDNLIIGEHIQTTHNLQSIINGNVYLSKHIESALKSNIFGIRFNSIVAMERCLV